ncbi:MAG: hypothetical protein FWE34_05050 [Defluviitaleaceae bacterium]|nr:hypothetical protein [Defluviitaleaceae bacterium]
MKKTLLALLVLLLSMTIFIACGENDREVLDDYTVETEDIIEGIEDDVEGVVALVLDIQFNETSSIIATTTGYTYTAQLGRRTYMFRGDNEDANTVFVNTVEVIAQGLEKFINIPDAQFRINASPADPLSYTFTHNELSINFDNNDTFGWFTHAMSRGNLPVWLSVGLEAYIRADAGMFSPTHDISTQELGLSRPFGDISFVPEMWGTVEMNTAIDIAYLFVNHLSENNLLENLIETYMGGDIATANEMVEGYFYSYFGEEMDVSLRLDYFHTNSSYAIVATDELGVYNFAFECFTSALSIEYIREYNVFLNASTAFVIDTFARFTYVEPLPLRTTVWHDAVGSAGGLYFPGTGIIHLFNSARTPGHLFAMAHEVSHAVSIDMISESAWVVFEEGFATAVSYLFYESDIATNLRLTSSVIDEIFVRAPEIPFFSVDFVHASAYYMLTYTDYTDASSEFFGWRQATANPQSDSIIHAIYSPFTGTSFVAYLVDTYGVESFMGVMWDIDNFVNAYGRDIHGMIEEWREFLHEFYHYTYDGSWDERIRWMFYG